MFIPRIYYPHALCEKSLLSLDKDVSHYLTSVLRLNDGDKIIFFNGEGGEYLATLIADKKRSQANVLSFNDISRESPLALHLGQGLARGDRMDFVIQKATELGVHSITPLLCTQSGVKLPSDRADKRLQHWVNIAQSACEQSGRTQLPLIHPPMTVKAWAQLAFDGVSLYGDPQQGKPLNTVSRSGQYRLAIGPESGWDQAETMSLQTAHFIPFTLGPRILRTETAGLVALGLLQGLFGDLS